MINQYMGVVPYTLQVVYFETWLFEVAGMSIWVISFARRNESLINDEGFLFSIKVRKDPKREEQTNKTHQTMSPQNHEK